jgi:hypothetical protein
MSATTKDASLLLKKGVIKVETPTAFYGDLSKFEAYVLQIRLY